MVSQLSKKAAPPLAKILATCRNNVSNTGPWAIPHCLLHNEAETKWWGFCKYFQIQVVLFWLKYRWNIFPMINSITNQLVVEQWLVAEHYLNQWWLSLRTDIDMHHFHMASMGYQCTFYEYFTQVQALLRHLPLCKAYHTHFDNI